MDEMQQHNECTAKFIEMANEMKDKEIDIRVISASLMAASGIYATYMAAGNAGALEPTGVDKVVADYRQTLDHIQNRTKDEIQSGGA